jgi:integrase
MVSIDDSGSETKCWLNYPNEIDQLATEARSSAWKRRIAVLLMGKVGLRASGVLTAKPEGLTYNDEGGFWQLEVKGKNTKENGEGKATRQAYVPDSVHQELDNYAKERDISPSKPFIGASVDSVRRWIREAREPLAESFDDNWAEVSSHDLRRSWANYHLVEEEVNPRVMMDIGGWSSYAALEPYLHKPSSEKIAEEMGGII